MIFLLYIFHWSIVMLFNFLINLSLSIFLKFSQNQYSYHFRFSYHHFFLSLHKFITTHFKLLSSDVCATRFLPQLYVMCVTMFLFNFWLLMQDLVSRSQRRTVQSREPDIIRDSGKIKDARIIENQVFKN